MRKFLLGIVFGLGVTLTVVGLVFLTYSRNAYIQINFPVDSPHIIATPNENPETNSSFPNNYEFSEYSQLTAQEIVLRHGYRTNNDRYRLTHGSTETVSEGFTTGYKKELQFATMHIYAYIPLIKIPEVERILRNQMQNELGAKDVKFTYFSKNILATGEKTYQFCW